MWGFPNIGNAYTPFTNSGSTFIGSVQAISFGAAPTTIKGQPNGYGQVPTSSNYAQVPAMPSIIMFNNCDPQQPVSIGTGGYTTTSQAV